MAKPVKHYDKWRVRWTDADGRRKCLVFKSHADAERALRRYEVEADEVRLGLRLRTPPNKTFDELCDYWLEHRAKRKRSST